MASIKSSFTNNEDLQLMFKIAKRLVETRFGQIKEVVLNNFQEAIDPDARLAGRIMAKYNALLTAGFTHDEAVRYTSESVSKTTKAVLASLEKTGLVLPEEN